MKHPFGFWTEQIVVLVAFCDGKNCPQRQWLKTMSFLYLPQESEVAAEGLALGPSLDQT